MPKWTYKWEIKGGYVKDDRKSTQRCNIDYGTEQKVEWNVSEQRIFFRKTPFSISNNFTHKFKTLSTYLELVKTIRKTTENFVKIFSTQRLLLLTSSRRLVLPIVIRRSIFRITVIAIATIITKIPSPMIIFPFVLIFIVTIWFTYTRFSIISIPVAHFNMRKSFDKNT